MILRLFKDICREGETFDHKYEAFIKITRPFEDFFREMEALIRNLRLFSKIKTLRAFLKTFLMELMFFL
jgi:hypothetical protein